MDPKKSEHSPSLHMFDGKFVSNLSLVRQRSSRPSFKAFLGVSEGPLADIKDVYAERKDIVKV